MTEEPKQKPSGVFSEQRVGFIPWIFNQVSTFIAQEGDFALQFMADFIRGPDYGRETTHLNRQVDYQTRKAVPTQTAGAEKPMTKGEKQVFVNMLRRKPSEPQMIYWKRKKAILNSTNKHDLIAQHSALQVQMAKRQKRSQSPDTEFIKQYRDEATIKRSQKGRRR